MPRTTINLEERLIREIKHLAADSRESMGQAINRLLLAAVAQQKASLISNRTIKWRVAKGARPAPDFNPANRDYLDVLAEK